MKSIKRQIKLAIYIIILITLSILVNFMPAQDLIVNGKTITVDGGNYVNILVINNGILNVNGDLSVNAINLEYGSININGNLSVSDSISIVAHPSGNMTVYGDSNYSNILILHSGLLNLLGIWNINYLKIMPTGKISVIPYTNSYKKSGTVVFNCYSITLKDGGLICADGAGADPRGHGGGYNNSGGGGYGGKGGYGYWSATNPGLAFGDSSSLTIDMGSSGGVFGGGSISIIAEIAQLDGTISSNGLNGGGGGGSGGGILLKIFKPQISGNIIANGGNGSNYCGGGGGGRIKIFYYTGILKDSLLSKLRVDGGSGQNSGKIGSIFTDAIPKAPILIYPVNKDSIATGIKPVFKFNILDSSFITDGRYESLLCKIELSMDSFRTVYKYYDQSVSLAGWSKSPYHSIDSVQFNCYDSLTNNIYQWRAFVGDQSIYSKSSEVYSFIIRSPIVAIEENKNKQPFSLQLLQNYPNPFNTSTTINYKLKESGYIILKIFNIYGQTVEILVNELKAAGEYKVKWQPKNLTSGIYYFRLKSGEHFETKKLILLK